MAVYEINRYFLRYNHRVARYRYEISLFSDRFPDDGRVDTLFFKDDEVEQFKAARDILRNELPVYYETKEKSLYTGWGKSEGEPVGANDEDYVHEAEPEELKGPPPMPEESPPPTPK